MYIEPVRFLLLLLLIAVATPSLAVTITVTSDSGQANVAGQCTLRDAMTAANASAPVGGCEAGEPGLDTIRLPQAANIVLSEIDNDFDGPNGLPFVREPLVIHGNGSILSRAGPCNRDGVGDDGEFRFLHVFFTELTLDSIHLAGGCSDGNFGREGYGGALLVASASGQATTMKRVTVERAFSYNAGAVALFGGNLIVEDSSILANESGDGASALFSPANGGSGRNVFLTNMTISGNGGGLGNDVGDAPVVALLAISRQAHLSNVTVTANNGVGAVRFGCDRLSCVRIKNSIVANNSGYNCQYFDDALVAEGINLSSDGTCQKFSAQNTPANLGPLADNGGSTNTHAPLPGSPAIDAVDDCTTVSSQPLTADQRGEARPWDGDGDGSSKCDLGAVEAGSTSLLFRSGFEALPAGLIARR